ncbi:conserved hypothetical protein [Ricinus communis]|uniref:PORR domain-containing protein n=1 Tax=Ricinus communis TaxID=3988 RepID=B9SB45_RICCO|nr:conserved hypothetical protein [Ricinus communis]|eukprot:XP_002523214.1 protein WHAT'S THIS FACTOR 1 homolog [Ricinus communis]
MMQLLSLSLPQNNCFLSKSSFLPSAPRIYLLNSKKSRHVSLSISCYSTKIVRDAKLDKHVVRQNKIRFVQKLKTLLLSKPKHYIPLHILSKCRSYLSLPDRRSIRSMILRYPSIFKLFTIPIPHLPFNATKPYSQLCVRLTQSAAALAAQELELQSAIANNLATKLQKLLMLSSHHRLLLSKLVHLAPDLGLPPNFRSRLCNDHPEKFKTVDTSYGRAVELVTWDAQLAIPLPRADASLDLIVDRPLKFKHLRLRKGLNLKRRHQDFLIKFEELPDVCPYKTSSEEFARESVEAEKRACAVVREILGMTVEKRTLLDHLTHFRKEFGFSNKLRGMIIRHPELFYVSVKGLRNSVLLVEGFDDKGVLLKKDEISAMKDQLMRLVSQSKTMRRERRNGIVMNTNDIRDSDDASDEFDDIDDDYDDGFENVFESEDSGFVYDFDNDLHASCEIASHGEHGGFWTVDGSNEEGRSSEPW